MEFFLSTQSLGMGIGTLLLFLLSGAVFVFWISPVSTKNKLQSNGFMGPSPSFPLGNIREMMKKKRSGVPFLGSLGITHDIHSIVFPYFAKWRESYGKVFIYWLGTEPFLYIGDPEFLKQVASGIMANSWGKPTVFKHDRNPMFGSGLVMAEGDDWTHHRHIITPAFSATNLKVMLNMMVESTTKMLDQWSMHLALGNHEIDVERELARNAAEIIAKTSFGINQPIGKKVFEKLQALQVMLFKSNRLVGVPFSKLLYLKQTLKARQLGKEIDQLLLEIINSRKLQPSVPQRDLLGLLLAGNQQTAHLEKKKKLTARELVDECKTFFFAGHETTALALTWTLFLLALHPEWQCILREEIMEVSGGGPLDSTMLTKLTKMGWVLNEVLRLYSPAPNVQRQAREDVSVGNFIIPKGTNMWVDVVGMHHDPALWGDDVNEFKPERFEGRINGGCKHRMGFLPFGFGGRMCVGRNLTMMEYKIVLTLILSKFSLSVSSKYIHSPTVMLSLRPSNGVYLVIQRLEGDS